MHPARVQPRMLRILVTALLVSTLLLDPALAANEPQAGDSSDCSDAVLSTLVGSLLVPARWSPLAGVVDVDAGTAYRVASEGTRVVLVFYDPGFRVLDRHLGADEGQVPAGAVRASVCVQEGVGFDGPLAYTPAATAAWTYQDGF